ncbi:hypothetical protein OC861_005800 [Tilletia horrida]|nr:hypothetical protein OC845_005371 [Tilletia horrida]KAK0561480.1 hypothetical protein OC861_005800 [Tilletia horrida]
MKFFVPALLLAGAASAAHLPVSKNVCQVLQKAELINLDLLGCSSVDVSILSKLKPVSKSTACKVLQEGGLVNLDVLGCSTADISVLSSDGTSVVPKATCSAKPTCKVLQTGLINIDLLGCATLGVSINLRAASHSPKPCNADTCSILQKGGLLNLSVLGCSSANVSVA